MTKAEFMASCPRDLKPYDIAHEKWIEEQNRLYWLNGIYVSMAIRSTIGNSGWFKSETTPIFRYPDEPIGLDGKTKEIDIDKEVDLFFAQEAVRRANWNRLHNKENSQAL